MSYRYSTLEKALIDLLSIEKKRLGAFRARIRHLRNVGVPHIRKPGSGRQVSYSIDNALELYVALLFQDLGNSPRSAAELGAKLIREHPAYARSPKMIIFVLPRVGAMWLEKDKAGFHVDQNPSCAIVNVPLVVKQLADALARSA